MPGFVILRGHTTTACTNRSSPQPTTRKHDHPTEISGSLRATRISTRSAHHGQLGARHGAQAPPSSIGVAAGSRISVRLSAPVRAVPERVALLDGIVDMRG